MFGVPLKSAEPLLSSQNKRIYFLLIFFSLAALGVFVYQLNVRVTESRQEQIGDRLRLFLWDQVEKEKTVSLSLALALAENRELAESLKEDDEDKAFGILNATIDSLQTYIGANLYAQIITRDLKVFTRSWDNDYYGFELGEFRKDLKEAREWSEPKASIETGRLLSFKALTPLKLDGTFLGYLEVIDLFDHLVENFRENGMELLILMDYDFLEVAVLMVNNPMLGDAIIAHGNYNRELVRNLSGVDMAELARKRQAFFADRFLVYEPMLDGRGIQLGHFVIAVEKGKVAAWEKSDDINFFLNFSQREMEKVVSSWEGTDGNPAGERLVKLRKLLAGEGEEMRERLRRELKKMDKEALIDLLVDEGPRKAIEGPIR